VNVNLTDSFVSDGDGATTNVQRQTRYHQLQHQQQQQLGPTTATRTTVTTTN